jgi:hypothetical protein
MSVAQIYLLNPDLKSNQIKEAIMERLHQLQALTCVCQEEDFTDYITEYLNNYFWLENTLINQIIELFHAYDKQLVS